MALVTLCFVYGCGAASEPARVERTVPAQARNDDDDGAAAPDDPSEALWEATRGPRRPTPPERPSAAIVPAPIADDQRLAPCAVELAHTTYDEETAAPTVRRRSVARLTRAWTDDLRETEWRDVAPIPLTIDQARDLLPDPSEHDSGRGVEIFATVGDGTLSYRFDARGRTTVVDWDPTADSSTYEYSYRYRCPAGVRPPRYDDD